MLTTHWLASSSWLLRDDNDDNDDEEEEIMHESTNHHLQELSLETPGYKAMTGIFIYMVCCHEYSHWWRRRNMIVASGKERELAVTRTKFTSRDLSLYSKGTPVTAMQRHLLNYRFASLYTQGGGQGWSREIEVEVVDDELVLASHSI